MTVAGNWGQGCRPKPTCWWMQFSGLCTVLQAQWIQFACILPVEPFINNNRLLLYQFGIWSGTPKASWEQNRKEWNWTVKKKKKEGNEHRVREGGEGCLLSLSTVAPSVPALWPWQHLPIARPLSYQHTEFWPYFCHPGALQPVSS